MVSSKFVGIRGAQGLYKFRLHRTILDGWLADVFKEYIRQDNLIVYIGKRGEGWSPTFGDSERQIASVLAPSLKHYADYVYLELPYESRKPDRRYKKKDRHYLDYWVYDHSRKRVLAIEVKETWHSIRANGTIKRIQRAWQDVNKQAGDPPDGWLTARAGDKVLRIAILLVRFYERGGRRLTSTRKSKKELKTHVEGLVKKIMHKAKHRANWIGVWFPNRKHQEIARWPTKGKIEVYPCALFLCRQFS